MTQHELQNVDKAMALLLNNCRQKECLVKDIIINAGDTSEELHYIIKGSVTVIVEDVQGKEIVLAYLYAGDFFGECGLFDTQYRRSAFVRAKTECTIATISYERLKSLQSIFPQVLFNIASQLAIRLRKTSRKVSDLAFTDVQGRIARTLLYLCEEPDAITHPNGMQIKITRQELGKIVGCSREMVGRVLKSIEEDHLISVSGKTIVVFGTR